MRNKNGSDGMARSIDASAGAEEKGSAWEREGNANHMIQWNMDGSPYSAS
jgi:hypothetical protein